VSQWADQTRRLSPEASAEPGRWYTARAEYMRGVMDAVSDPTVRQVVVMSAAQVGKTEVLLNMIGFHVDQDPAPIPGRATDAEYGTGVLEGPVGTDAAGYTKPEGEGQRPSFEGQRQHHAAQGFPWRACDHSRGKLCRWSCQPPGTNCVV